MGGLGTSISVRGDGDRSAAYDAVWTILRELVMAQLSHEDRDAASNYLLCVDRENRHHEFDFMFPDHGGTTRSKYAWFHWTQVAIAHAWDAIDACLHGHGLSLEGERWTHDRDGKLVALRGGLWHIQDEALLGDGDAISIEDLDAEVRLVDAARSACACPLCALPDPPGLLALVRADAPMPELVDDVRTAARSGDAWDELVAAYPTLAPGERGLALYALAEMRRDDARTAWLVTELRAALATNGRTAEAAAEVAGTLGIDLAVELRAVLGRLGVDAELRAKVTLALAKL